MVHVSCDELCKARRKGKYESARVVSVNDTRIQVEYVADGHLAVLEPQHVWKSKKRVHSKSTRTERYTPRKAKGRRVIHLIPVRFEPGKVMGDFHRMLSSEEIRGRSVMLFNDNKFEWETAGLHPSMPLCPGGGNACARPWQHCGDSIGMPTGPFKSLDESHDIRMRGGGTPIQPASAKEIIDEAVRRVVRLFLRRPDKDTLYYSVNASDPQGSTRIGLSIFAGAVGEDVVEYISSSIQTIPKKVQLAWVRA